MEEKMLQKKIMKCVMENKVKKMEELIKKNPNLKFKHEKTPVFLAGKLGRIDCLECLNRVLKDHKIQLNWKKVYTIDSGRYEEAYNFEMDMMNAAAYSVHMGNYESFKCLVKNIENLDYVDTEKGFSLLMVTIMYPDRIKYTKYMLDLGSDLLPTNDGKPALAYLCEKNDTKCADLLFECCDIDVNEEDNDGRTTKDNP